MLLLFSALILSLFLPAGSAAQAPPPDEAWRTFRTEHFRVTYGPGLEPLARRAGDAAERTYAVLRDELGDPPRDVIDVLVTDHVDYTNGLANIFPSSRITIYARPPTSMPQLAWSGDWIELIVAHELVHVFHLVESGLVGHLVRSVFGRVPMIWPVFPVAGSPTWNVEGLATYYESRLTGSGRVPGSFHDMIIRTAVLEDRLPALDQLSAPNPVWPGGQKSYGYGSRLMAHISQRYGPEAHRAIVEATGASLLPTFLAFDHVSRKAVGEPFDALYDDWRRAAAAGARQVADSIRARGLTRTEPVAGRGPYAAEPRLSPDARYLSFAADDYRSSPATRLLDLSTGEVRTLGDRNQFGTLLGPASWLPDGSAMVIAQLELAGPYRAFSDLWRLDLRGGAQRLTRGQRLTQPDVAPDGRRVAAIRARPGVSQLVVHDLGTGETALILDAAPGDAFDSPRWSPDGRRVAVARDSGGRVDLVVVDVETGELVPLTRDDALDLSPAWSPDGEWVLWWSDRTGVPNIMAARAPAEPGAEPVVYQVTNLLTGGFYPEVSHDGRTLYLSVYHHDGWQIEATTFDPSTWRPAEPSVLRHGTGLVASVEPTDQGAASSDYRPWATLRPYYWVPEWRSLSGAGGSLRFLGVRTGGRDLVSRHEWAAAAAVDPGTGRVEAGAGWLYRGLGVADLRLSTSRSWRYGGSVAVASGQEAIWERVDRIAASALLWRSRWRSTGWLQMGTEVERRGPEGHRLSRAELEAEGWSLAPARTLVGTSGGGGYSNARVYPFSISPENGVRGSVSVGRWWDLPAVDRVYDELVARSAGYRALPLGGYTNHVLAIRAAGLVRAGPQAPLRAIGGVPGRPLPAGASEILGDGVASPASFPVRGHELGTRRGTRAWTVSGEWRFPLHLRNAPGRILGFSLTGFSGSVFADMGDAWCPAAPQPLQGCSAPGERPIASAGGELTVDFGIFHNHRLLARAGVAQPLLGPDADPSLYLSLGRAF